MSSAAEALQQAAIAAISAIDGIGRVYDAPPLQAAVPYALVETDLETDWSHKSGLGRDIRLAVTLFDTGERAVGLRGRLGKAETVLADIAGQLGDWRVVSMQYLRTRIVRDRYGQWAGVIEFRTRALLTT